MNPEDTKIYLKRAVYSGVNWIYLTLLYKTTDGWISDRWEDESQMMATPPVIPRPYCRRCHNQRTHGRYVAPATMGEGVEVNPQWVAVAKAVTDPDNES